MPTNVIMPALELAQETGKVLRWFKSPGDTVRKGEPLVEIETDKVITEIEAPAAGIHGDVTARAGDVVPVEGRCDRAERRHQHLAVAIDDGLVVPVIHRAGTLSLAEIAARREDVVSRAQAGKLRPADIRGGGFTISNLGAS